MQRRNFLKAIVSGSCAIPFMGETSHSTSVVDGASLTKETTEVSALKHDLIVPKPIVIEQLGENMLADYHVLDYHVVLLYCEAKSREMQQWCQNVVFRQRLLQACVDDKYYCAACNEASVIIDINDSDMSVTGVAFPKTNTCLDHFQFILRVHIAKRSGLEHSLLFPSFRDKMRAKGLEVLYGGMGSDKDWSNPHKMFICSKTHVMCEGNVFDHFGETCRCDGYK